MQEQGQARNTQGQYAGVIDCVNKVFQKEGLRGFYRGCATNLMRTTPSAIITFTSYEMIHRFLQKVIPPDNNHSKAYPKSNGRVISPHQSNEGSGQAENSTDFRQSQTQTNKTTPSIPFGNEDQLIARH